MSVLKESQSERDIELSKIMNVSVDFVKSIDISDRKNLRKFTNTLRDGEIPNNQKDMEYLYTKDNYDNFSMFEKVAYFKVYMYTSVNRRGKDLQKNLNLAKGNCLDYGSGVGTHSIYLMQRNNKVWMYDIPTSPLLSFALERIKNRKLIHNLKEIYTSISSMPKNFFDYVNCLDVIEHCYDPYLEIKHIYNILKPNGLLHLEVSEWVKPDGGHFSSSIKKWKNEGKEFLNKHFKQEGDKIYRAITQ